MPIQMNTLLLLKNHQVPNILTPSDASQWAVLNAPKLLRHDS